jgi:TRAP transporter TAXI family solute receptor
MTPRRGFGIAARSDGVSLQRSLARRDVLIALSSLPLLAARPSRAADDIRYFRIGTAATTGTYFQIGGVLANAISKPPGSRDCDRGGSCGVPGLVAVAQATQGSVENVQAVDGGRLESALAQSDVAYWAFSGTGLFKGKPSLTHLRSIASLFPETVHIVVRADGPISALKDLKGKRVGLGEKESGTLADARLILDAAGIGERQVKPDYRNLGQTAEALAHDELDAFFLFGGYPVPAIAELASGTPVRLIPIANEVADRLTQRNAFFARDTIPGGTYAGIAEATESIGTRALWIVGSEVPEALVFDITKALWHDANRRLLDQGHPMAKRITLATALEGLVLPLHPGAERAYRELGIKVPGEGGKLN